MTQVVPRRAATRTRPQSATFGGIDDPSGAPAPDGPDFAAIHDSPEFTALRRRFRRFVFPMTGLFLLWYLAYVLLAAYAADLMSTRLVGSVNLGLVLGLLQFASTITITALYVRWARKRVDPGVAEIRESAGAGR
ncbi:DUF485 domain-containing protein [Actinokineospora auranticolor]|uniref:Uncharacterized membrane protein (DUF485 family) n=1 Tax=Actinokineospora auranticolor TaxID=155976 RepID=A0A2S6GBU0_9PSEU|nr:DUF485 domain-containing protein [Actinokineospora auranticolor]PPK61589.1 uncharacterized membrane protein (DUF485 family) [Actinokineospora auranticolor]